MRLGLFLHRPSPFNSALFSAIRRGFEVHGVTVDGACRWLDEAGLHAWCNDFKPDVMLEMNRSRDQAPGLPRPVRHIAWIVDTLGHDTGAFDGSELLYLFGKPWRGQHAFPNSGLVDWLPPGFDDDVYRPEQRDPEADCLFAGHIPLPWRQTELDRVVHRGPEGSLDFRSLLYRLRAMRAFNNGGRQLAPHVLRTAVATAIEMATGDALRLQDLDDRMLRYDIQVRLIRMENRRRMLAAAQRLTRRVVVYGTENWRAWSEFAACYRGALDDPAALARAYRTGAVTLHEGVGTHFRVFECMGSGGTILYRNGSDIDELNEIRDLFEPGVHYLQWSADCDLMRHRLRDHRLLARIGGQAARHVHENHTWRHRAARILADLRRCA